MRKVYMDYSSGKPIDNNVLEAMIPYFKDNYGNPSSFHEWGRKASTVVKKARNEVAALVNAESSNEIIFTSGGTESNNLAIQGIAYRNRSKGNHIITSSIEHISIINTCKYLSKQGFEVTYLPVDNYGFVDLKSLKKSITNKTILISIMYANGEIGTIEPIKEIGTIANDNHIPFHVDGVAATGQTKIDVQKNHIDLLSISSNDMYGPRGVGALYVALGTPLQPIIQGGGQERGFRSGTENIPGIVGMGEAADITRKNMDSEIRRLKSIKEKLVNKVLKDIPESYLNGHPTKRLPNNANLRFSYIEGEALILSLDMEGVACSSGSACTSKTLEPSHALLSIGLKHEEAHGSLLFTLGKQNNEEDIEYIVDILPGIVKRLRKMSPLTPKELNV